MVTPLKNTDHALAYLQIKLNSALIEACKELKQSGYEEELTDELSNKIKQEIESVGKKSDGIKEGILDFYHTLISRAYEEGFKDWIPSKGITKQRREFLKIMGKTDGDCFADGFLKEFLGIEYGDEDEPDKGYVSIADALRMRGEKLGQEMGTKKYI